MLQKHIEGRLLLRTECRGVQGFKAVALELKHECVGDGKGVSIAEYRFSYLASALLENVGGIERLRCLAGLQNKRIAFPDNMSKC